jgi:hypothetical protein
MESNMSNGQESEAAAPVDLRFWPLKTSGGPGPVVVLSFLQRFFGHVMGLKGGGYRLMMG